jgi:hypothetical protein
MVESTEAIVEELQEIAVENSCVALALRELRSSFWWRLWVLIDE